MKLFNIEASRNLTLPDMYINIGHFLDHFMMLIFAKAAFDAGRHFGLSYDEIIIYDFRFVSIWSRCPISLSLIHI